MYVFGVEYETGGLDLNLVVSLSVIFFTLNKILTLSATKNPLFIVIFFLNI